MKPNDQETCHPLLCHIEPLLADAFRLCGDLDTAQELTQQTLLCALTAMERGEQIQSLGGYLHAVLTRRYHDMLRRKYRRPVLSIDCSASDALAEIADPDADFVAQLQQDEAKRERAEHCRRALAYLAKTYRHVIALHYFHGKSVKQIAKELDIPEGTVKSRLDFGRRLLKKGLTEMEHYTENSYQQRGADVAGRGRRAGAKFAAACL